MFESRPLSSKSTASTQRVVIVAHGQPSDSATAEAALAGFAAQVGAHLPDCEVSSATLAAPGAFERCLTEAGPGALIYPLFMTGGWFTGEALRDRIADANAQVLPPFGTDAGLPQLAADLVQTILKANGWLSEDVTLLIAAHGSGRSPNAARDTSEFAASLARLLPLRQLEIGYIEESPFLREVANDLGPRSICLPFFAAEGEHVIQDIPEALNAAGFTGLLLDPIGRATQIPALVARRLRAALTDKACA